MASVTFSPTLINHVRLLYDFAIDDFASRKKRDREGINFYTDFAGPAYVTAVAAIEAFVNEITFGAPTKYVLKDAPLWSLEQRWVEKLEVLHKLVIVPHLLFGKSFDRDSQPFQDMTLLVKVRNDFVHYKMEDTVPNYVKPLADRGIALSTFSEVGDYVWVHKLSTSEGIRWANNTVCRVASSFVDFLPEQHRKFLFGSLIQNFVEISVDYTNKRLQEVEEATDRPEATSAT